MINYNKEEKTKLFWIKHFLELVSIFTLNVSFCGDQSWFLTSRQHSCGGIEVFRRGGSPVSDWAVEPDLREWNFADLPAIGPQVISCFHVRSDGAVSARSNRTGVVSAWGGGCLVALINSPITAVISSGVLLQMSSSVSQVCGWQDDSFFPLDHPPPARSFNIFMPFW